MDNDYIDPIDRGHTIKLMNDKIAIIGELEHIRRHALRSYGSIEKKLESETDKAKIEELREKAVHYFITSKEAQKYRRYYMGHNFPLLSDEDWCLCKSAASLRQLIYETDLDGDSVKSYDRFIDEIWGNALGMDLTGCRDCNEDRNGE